MRKRSRAELIDKDNPEWTAEDFARAVPFGQLPVSLRSKLADKTRRSLAVAKERRPRR